MRNTKTKELTIVAMFIATISVLAVLNQVFLAYWPFPIKPTILHVPVILASLVLGPKLGGIIGGWWGMNSVIVATVTAGPTNFLFSPLQPVMGTQHGDIRALIVAIFPRILVGILPYFIYKGFQKVSSFEKIGLVLSGFFGSMVNTVFVMSAIYFIFDGVLHWGFERVLTTIVATNSIAEAVLAAVLVTAITPTLWKVYNKNKA